jgi:hypothetical protein
MISPFLLKYRYGTYKITGVVVIVCKNTKILNTEQMIVLCTMMTWTINRSFTHSLNLCVRARENLSLYSQVHPLCLRRRRRCLSCSGTPLPLPLLLYPGPPRFSYHPPPQYSMARLLRWHRQPSKAGRVHGQVYGFIHALRTAAALGSGRRCCPARGYPGRPGAGARPVGWSAAHLTLPCAAAS